jgi:hypothetical protein
MATPVVPSQFAVGKNKIVHKPTKATFSFDTGHTTLGCPNSSPLRLSLPLQTNAASSYHRMLVSAVGLYAVGFQMSRNSRNKNPRRTTIFRGTAGGR